MIDFKKSGQPKDAKELAEHIEDIRSAVLAGGKATDEALEKVAADLKVAHESVQVAQRAEKKVLELEENIKALHEAARTTSNGNLEKQIRTLPIVHKVEKDEDYRTKVGGPVFNLLAMSRKDLRVYLDNDAYDWAMRFRRLNNMTLSAHHIMQLVNEGSPQRKADYERRGGFKGLPTWGALENTLQQGARALDIATSGGILEWIPTLYSSEKFDDVRDQLAIAGQFRFLAMPQSPWTLPTLVGFMTAKISGEAQADALGGNTIISPTDFTVANRTLTAKKMTTISYFSREAEQDSIIALLPAYDEEQAYAQAFGLENMVVNGQATSTIDTGSDPATDDVRDHADGVRWSAQQVGSQVDLSAGLAAEKLAAMIQVAGKYAELNGGFFGTGYVGLAKSLVLKDGAGNLLYLTRDKAGDAATLFTGTVGVLMGYPFVISGAYPQNLNATGIIDGAGTKTGFVFCNKRPWVGGNRQGLEIESDRSERFSYDQITVRSIQRVAFKSLLVPSPAKPFVVAGVGL